jgi:hypothetical protein
MRSFVSVAASVLLVAFAACSDDDGSDVLPNGPPGAGGGGAGGVAADAGPGGTGGGPSAGTGGSVAGSGGSAGCTPAPVPDAGSDGGVSDAGPLDGGSADGGDADASSGPVGSVSFASDIHPIFEVSCAPCHVTFNSGGHNVGGEIDAAYAEAVDLGQTLVSRIDGGGMPPPDADPPNDCGADGRGDQPGDEGCLTVDQVALVQAWIDQCYPR